MKYSFFIFLLITATLFWFDVSFAQQQEEYELTSLSFEGNNWFSDSELRAILQSKETPWWLWRFLNSFTPLGSPPNYFDSTSISLDVISLKSFYAVNGFFQADINYYYTLDTLSKTAELTYVIKENDMHFYGQVNYYGLEALDSFMISQVIPFFDYRDKGLYIQSDVEENNNNVVTLLKNNGFMLANYDSTVIHIDTVKNLANLDNFFTLGKYFRFNEIRIEKEGEGKELVSDELIRYVTNINPGEPYKEEELSKSRLRLARTGLFNSINLKGVVEDTIGAQVPLLIRGNIGSVNELSPEVFADNELNTFNIGVGLSYIRKNFFGDARKLTIRARFRLNDISNLRFSSDLLEKTLQSEVDLSAILEQPFLFSRSVAGRLEGYLKSYRISSVLYDNFGAVFTSTVDMPSYTFINLLNPYLRLDRLAYDFPAETENEDITIESRSFTSSLGTEIGSTTTDDIFYPTKGRTISLIGEIASADVTLDSLNNITNNFGTIADELGYYYKLQLTLGYYLAASKDLNTVVGIKVKAGTINMLKGGQELIAPNQTFFAGGSNSVRGWRARELIPADSVGSIIPPSLNEELRIRGGSILLEGSFEYRRKFEEDLGYALFMDYGNTWNNFEDMRLDGIAVAVGFGFRYYSPIAPFRLDFGFKFYDPADQKFIFDKAVFKTMQFHFGIGEAF